MHHARRRRSASIASLALCALAGSCTPVVARHTTAPPGAPGAPAAPRASANAPTPGAPAANPRSYAPPAAAPTREQLLASLPGAARLSPDAIAARHPLSFTAPTAVDTEHLDGFSTIQGHPYALRGDELTRLRAQGVVIADRIEFANFMSGYARLYIADQPVYFSADAMLNALHLGFDSMVADIEADALGPALVRSLTELRTALAGAPGAALSAETRADLDAYLAITLGLLQGRPAAPVAGASSALVDSVYTQAAQGTGTGMATVFGAPRQVDYSQFRPRGHYAGVPAREQYFRGVMWLGREGLRLVDTVEGQRVLSRRAIAGAVALRAIATPSARAGLTLVDDVVSGFAGEAESLTVHDLDELAAAIDRAGGLGRVADADLLRMVDSLRGERPRVATTLLHHPDDARTTVPEPVALSLSPQRYSPDAMVLSRVSYDRIMGGGVARMMPDPLDAAFAALGNDQALGYLAPELHRFDYATELETSRLLVDAHEAAYWQGSMYGAWLGALRQLSPRETRADDSSLPPVMTTEAWGRRLMGTQLAAWAELRHDMVLYTAQSYSAMPGCSYPAAYVDPYPAFWSALGAWVTRGQAVLTRVPWQTAATGARYRAWLERAGTAVARLGEMAQRERDGQELTAEQLEFMNRALRTHERNVVCTTVTEVDGGWFYELFEPRLDLGDVRAVVADVHTQPADEAGNEVGRVLHAGTGMPRAMVVVAGPPGHRRAYIGLASAYRERTTEHFDRLTDERWLTEIGRATTPAWLAPVVAR